MVIHVAPVQQSRLVITLYIYIYMTLLLIAPLATKGLKIKNVMRRVLAMLLLTQTLDDMLIAKFIQNRAARAKACDACARSVDVLGVDAPVFIPVSFTQLIIVIQGITCCISIPLC